MTTVTGGTGGVSARYDDMLALAGLYDASGDDLREAAVRVGAITAGLAGELDVLVAAALSPTTAGAAAASLAEAAAALVPLALASEGQASLLEAAVTAYRGADEVMTNLAQVAQDVTGFGLGLAAPGIALGAGAWWAYTSGAAELADLVGADDLAGLARGLRSMPVEQLQRLLLEHPGLAEHLAGGAAGLEQGLLAWFPPGARALLGDAAYPGSYEEALASLALFFRDGEPALSEGGRPQPLDGEPPASVAALLLGVQRRQTRPLALPGEIGIRRITGSDGVARVVVELPGTESWALVAGEQMRDLSTNVHTMAGGSTVYQRGVLEALRRAGVTNEPVMLVGHSQGGMTAAALAADADFRSRINVSHVVTAGAPIARNDIPASVQVLALENRYDLVPQLDGRDNPDQGNVTTVVFDAQRGDAGLNHELNGYASLAESLPTDDPSVAAFLSSAGGFLDPLGTVDVEAVGTRTVISRATSGAGP